MLLTITAMDRGNDETAIMIGYGPNVIDF